MCRPIGGFETILNPKIRAGGDRNMRQPSGSCCPWRFSARLAAGLGTSGEAMDTQTAFSAKIRRPISAKYPRLPFPAQQQAWPGLQSLMRPRPDSGEPGYKGAGRLLGREALVTGGDSGIGRAAVIAFARGRGRRFPRAASEPNARFWHRSSTALWQWRTSAALCGCTV